MNAQINTKFHTFCMAKRKKQLQEWLVIKNSDIHSHVINGHNEIGCLKYKLSAIIHTTMTVYS